MASSSFMLSESGSSSKDPKKVWINRYLRIDREFNKELNEALVQAAEDVEREVTELFAKAGVGATVRRAQLTGASGVITKVLHALFLSSGTLIGTYRAKAATESVKAANVWDDEVLKALIPDPAKRKVFKSSLELTASRNVEAMVKRVTGDTVTLSRRVYRSEALARGQIDRVINSSLAKGDSAAELARKARAFIHPSTPGGASFAAKRLGRTEINNAFHAQAIETNKSRPWVSQIRWHLSGSHTPRPGDPCERYYRQGVFPVGSTPKKPHPQCLCYITPEVPPIEVILQQYESGIYDQWLADNRLERDSRVLSPA
ncbi:MuF-like minor capsid protein [Gordonia phage Zany]|uniref:MuF-like minor capsid protein n=1 Tax=Gordonia phage Zany TaxID=2910759 RepID=A0AA49H0L5_9CAUD|nr:MuF-like minor capsid protein [Gordonia phage Zany]